MFDEFELEKHRYFSFVVIFPKGNRSIRFRIRQIWIYLGLAMSLLGVVTGVMFGVRGATQSEEARAYRTMQKTAAEKEAQLNHFEREINAIRRSLIELGDREEQMHDALMGRSKKPRPNFFKEEPSPSGESTKPGAVLNPSNKTQQIAFELESLKDGVTQTQMRVLRLGRRIQQCRARFAVTPSIWPIYGGVLSDFGWRVHPRTGRMQFHKGIDIPSWIGAPIKCTADGVVEFTGWGGGYGWLIILNHDYGYRTFYAHLSEIMVTPGRTVRKGQIIGKVGETGMATGPHVHYEIRHWRDSISPRPFLDLDLFTASTRVW